MAKRRLSAWRALVLLGATVIFTGIVYRWISLERLQRVATTPVPEAVASPTAEPSATKPPVVSGPLDTARIFNGITLHATVDTPAGTDASTERGDPQSYIVELQLKARMPAPNQTIEELAKVTPQLPTLLPGLATMVGPDSVSPFFADLYATKVRILRDKLGRLDQLLSRHNFYDCQTVLQLRHPQSQRRAILIQGDMDVDADGSDGDRVPGGHGVSTNFKPFTSYRWPKKTTTPNPYLQATEDKIERYEVEAELKTSSVDRKRDLRAAIAQLRIEIDSLKKFSYLIGATDPFIVVPGPLARPKDGPKVGDYALVIYGDKIYPAFVGDIGPTDKVGEAALRIAKEINSASTPYNRPVSDLKVTYLVFPGTGDTPWGPPDLEKIQMRCQALVDEIGGASAPLHKWEDIIPKPTPTPTATPTATASPSPVTAVSPAVTTSPAVAPSPAATFAFPVKSASPSPEAGRQ